MGVVIRISLLSNIDLEIPYGKFYPSPPRPLMVAYGLLANC